MFPKVIFVLGGAASGKSDFAETLVGRQGQQPVYLATAQAFDSEMRHKIDAHIARRGDGWLTHEVPMDVAATLTILKDGQVCLMDCATMWLSNHLMAESDLLKERSDLVQAIRNCPARLVIVSNEVGHGVVPDNALARRFREEQGRLNIALAAEADLAVQVHAGLPLVLKGQLP